jgi:hypothetical protein
MKEFEVGDRVSWNSEAGRVSGIIKKKVTSPIKFKGYTVHASAAEPQYLIKSEKTDHLAMHKPSALHKLRSTAARDVSSSSSKRKSRASSHHHRAAAP